MSELLHELITTQAAISPDANAISFRDTAISYADLHSTVNRVAQGFAALGLARNERIAVYLPKRPEAVVSFFAVSAAGGVFVPINPLLKEEQVAYILQDCNVRVLITSHDRFNTLKNVLADCHDLRHVVFTDTGKTQPQGAFHFHFVSWDELRQFADNINVHRRIDSDMAAILYTSGSTGKPKGVVLSHRNMVTGAKSVANYLGNHKKDRILAVLPFSFDYGLSQLTTAFTTGACTVLMDYLFPRDVIKMVAKENITGLAAVPPLWNQIAPLAWPEEARQSLRYITNSGGAMPKATLEQLRKNLTTTQIYLMYGLTEAFRSTFLHPVELDKRPESIGKAIPNAEILVVREDGALCAPGEPGELVHRGALVAMGYWNDPQKTSERFKPAPSQDPGLPLREIAVWSGDTVRMDEEGFLYFVGRRDEMIKTSGYRVSPTEIEEVIYASGLVEQVAALGIPHPILGQAIVAVVTPKTGLEKLESEAILQSCKNNLAGFMVPAHIHMQQDLPRNPNGKIDRKKLAEQFQDLFQENHT